MKFNISDLLIAGEQLVIFFHNHITRLYQMDDLQIGEHVADYVKKHFHQIRITPGGYGVTWNGIAECSAMELSGCGNEILSEKYKIFLNISEQYNIVLTLKIVRRIIIRARTN